MAERRYIRSLSIFEWITTPAGASGVTDLYQVPLDRELEVERLEIYFPVGCESQVEVKVTLDGIQQYPYGEWYRGDDTIFISTASRLFPPGSKLQVEWVNNDTEHDLAFSIHLSCIEREKPV